MPIARFQMPDGRVARFEVPDGATPEQAQALMGQYMQRTERMKPADPTEGNSFLDNALAATGKGMVSVARALGASPEFLRRQGLPGTKQEADAQDAPLMKTAGGKVGNVVGQAALAAPAMLIPGANTYTGAALIGAGTGAAFTEGDIADRAKAAAGGAVGGLAGKGLGDLLGWGVPKLAERMANSRATAQVANAQRDAAAIAAKEAGYVIPPADVNPSVINEALGGLSGKIKTAQAASVKNQNVTNSLAKKALGIPDDVPLNVNTLADIRQQAGQAYEAVKGIGTVKADAAYTKALDGLKAQYEGAAKDFPGLAKGEITSLVDSLKQPQFDASSAVDAVRVLRETADKAFRSGDTGLGKTAKAAAGEMENLLERNLQASGAPSDLISAFRDARQTIAKTYTVQNALNNETGDVSSQVLASLLKKGKPLSGDLETAARVGAAFPKATQALKEAPKAWSPLDMVAGGAGVGMGSPTMVGLAAARPMARSLLLSKPYQGLLANPRSYAPGLLESALPAIDSQLVSRGLTFGGGLLGVQLGQ